MRWPPGFLWGTGASSTQCEGAAPASDWIDWERTGKAPVSGEGNGFARRYAEDFALFAGLGLRHHRLSIEWARIEPEPGRRDPAAIDHYRRVLEAAHAAGVAPWVCLHHFTLPRWFAAAGGFLRPENRTEPWLRHVDFVAERFGDLVSGWKPVNEPVAYAAAGWLGHGFPPGRDSFPEFAAALEGIQLASFEAALRLRRTGAPVATIFNLSTIHSVDAAAEPRARAYDDVVWGSWLHALRDGELRVPGRAPIARPELTGAFDLVGFSYYSAMGVDAVRGAVPHPPGAPRSPLGYGIWPEGLRLVLERLHAELPGRPLLVCELGLGTDDDATRAAYLRETLAIVSDAVARGIDVRGVFHWTGVDNYEWLHGYDVAFGLVDRERRVRESAAVIAAEAGGRV